MYLPLVAVLEHVVLTFISRVKQQMAKICENKTAHDLLWAKKSMEQIWLASRSVVSHTQVSFKHTPKAICSIPSATTIWDG